MTMENEDLNLMILELESLKAEKDVRVSLQERFQLREILRNANLLWHDNLECCLSFLLKNFPSYSWVFVRKKTLIKPHEDPSRIRPLSIKWWTSNEANGSTMSCSRKICGFGNRYRRKILHLVRLKRWSWKPNLFMKKMFVVQLSRAIWCYGTRWPEISIWSRNCTTWEPRKKNRRKW